MKVFVFTIPKAGTYFIAEFLQRLGFGNSGFHINKDSMLDTKKLSLAENAQTPSKAHVKQPYMASLKQMKNNELAVGHFALPLMGWLYPNFHFVCAYRHPRKTLVSEFIDFRFRRSDIPWVSRKQIPDDRAAFATYMERHGPNHAAVVSQMLAVSMLVHEPLCKQFAPKRYTFVNFDHLLKNPQVAVNLAESLGVKSDRVLDIYAEALSAETKTKASTIDMDRDSLWSDAARAHYKALKFDEYVARGIAAGWNIDSDPDAPPSPVLHQIAAR